MIHLIKDRCGYQGYICKGIVQADPLPAPICDNINYDNFSDSRPIDNNFLNLPQNFKSIVQNVSFVDLGSDALWDATKCVTAYQPFKDGLMDAFMYLQQNEAYIAGYGDYNNQLQCYSDSKTEYPGILLPTAQLSPFANPVMEVVPTSALASAQKPKEDGGGRGIKSGCTGFYVTARNTKSYETTFSVAPGKLLVSTDSAGEPVTIDVAGLQNQKCQGRTGVQSIQVYAIAQYDIVTQMWKGVLDWKSATHDFQSTTPTNWIKQKQIATIKYVSRQIVDVIQTQCSPIDLRDWISQETLPKTEGNFVFMYKGFSGEKGWIQVRDC